MSAYGSLYNFTPPGGWPKSLTALDVYTSPFIPLSGLSGSVGVKMAGNGSLSLQRYLDATTNFPIGAAITQAVTGGTGATAGFNDGMIAMFLVATLTDTSNATNAVSSMVGVGSLGS
jgi:hypothetical protein